MTRSAITTTALAWALALLTTAAACLAAEPGGPRRPNIVVILADDMGYGDVGAYNPDSKIRTPHLDRLAADGLRFTDGHAPASWCTPTRYGLLTGRYPFRTSLAWNRKPVIEDGRLTLPAMLRERGYRTVMVGKWHLGFEKLSDERAEVHRGGPIDRGFDTWFGIPASLDIPPYYYVEGDRPVAPPSERIGDRNTDGWTPIQGEFWRAGGVAPGFRHVDVLPDLTARTEREIAEHAEKAQDRAPLFLYLALPAPHTPWVPTPEFAGKSDVPLYGDFMMQVDATVGRVTAALEKAGMADDTIVLFSSDNGPVWYDEDVARHGHDSAGPWRGMKADMWEAGHRMPLIVRWPGVIEPGRVTGQLACLTDCMATFAAVVGYKLPADAAEDSVNLLPVLTGEAGDDKPVRDTLIVTRNEDTVCVRRGPWKLIPFRGSGGFTKPSRIRPKDIPEGEPVGQLYHLANDPDESDNLYDKHPEIVRELEELLKQAQSTGRTVSR